MFLLLEITTALLSLCLAWLNKWPIVKFRESGATSKMEKDFHAANACVKILLSFIVTLALNLPLAERLVCFFSFSLIQWVVFDIAVNHFTEKDLFYIGETAKIDKWLHKIFPHGDAGEVKAAACLSAIIGLNILFYFL